MTRWFRFYDDAINDPKILRLSDELYRAWTILLCVASKHDGKLPPAEDIALALRMKTAKVAEWLTRLVKAGLIDQKDGGFEPHNWSGRQFKSDNSTARVKRFRNGQRNVSETASETAPESEQKQITEQSRVAPVSVEAELRQKIVAAFASANSPNIPDTSRVGLWLSQGYDPAIILGVVSSIISKKPSLASLNYFDSPIREAHTQKAPKRIELDNGAAARHAKKVHVKADTPQWRAWEAHLGKAPAQDRHFGWFFDSEWPPGHDRERVAS